MSVESEVQEYLSKFRIGTILTTREIKEGVNQAFGTEVGSVIPTDYCYNMVNKDSTSHDFKNGHPRLLECIQRGKFRYLGPNYAYSGIITKQGLPVDKWVKGEYTIRVI